MASKSGREITVLLRSSIAETGPDGQPSIHCLECQGPLETHQPDADLPGLILATCDLCKAWHLVDFEDSDDVAFVIIFPNHSQLRKVLRP